MSTWKLKKELSLYCLYAHLQHHNDTTIKTHADFFIKIFTFHFIARVRKGLLKVCVWEGAGDRTELKYFDLHCYGRQRGVFLVFPDAQPEAPASTLLGAGFLYCISSATSLVPKLHRGYRGPLQFYLPHSSISVSSSTATGSWLPSWQRYIIVQRPLDRPLDLWNRMFNRHQAEITAMQFRGHSLPVRQSMRVSWDFLPCPISLANFRPRDFLS